MTEERILDFLDGNLGASEEEELLHRLAVSPERRSVLKQHLQMRELTATLARRQYVPVPKVLTASLFTALAASGYAGPKMPAIDPKESLIASLEKNLNRSAETIVGSRSPVVFRRSSAILASVAAFIFGAALIYFMMPQARHEKFAASVLNMLPGESTTTRPVRAEFASIPAQLSAVGNIEMNNSTHRAKEIVHASLQNAVSVRGLDNSAIRMIGVKNLGESPLSVSKKANLSVIPISDAEYPPAIAAQAFIGGSGMTAKNPFDRLNPEYVAERTFWKRMSLSFRSGEGKAPGNEQALTGSLIELKASYDISDLFAAKISIGQFMPYETQAVTANPGLNADGFRILQLKPVLQYRAVFGAELGAKFTMFDAPFEVSGGFISDLLGSIIPRLGFFTSLTLQDNLIMNLGLEGMIYSHDISSSLRNAQITYAGEHPSLIGALQNKESTGFIGPAIELMWHF